MDEVETVVARWRGSVPKECGYTKNWRAMVDVTSVCGQPAEYEVVSRYLPKETFLVCAEHAARARISPDILSWLECIRTWPRPAASPRY